MQLVPCCNQPCPVCGRHSRVTGKHFGRPIVCGHCGGEFVGRDVSSESDSVKLYPPILGRADRLLATVSSGGEMSMRRRDRTAHPHD